MLINDILGVEKLCSFVGDSLQLVVFYFASYCVFHVVTNCITFILCQLDLNFLRSIVNSETVFKN